jgi:ectoine hydroxylase-related dioxygenase (phytanoyl-CoA dioxygenase family)
MSVLNDGDRRFWEENGYVVVHDAVPRENLDAVIQTIAEFLEIDPDDPETWYRGRPRRLGFVEIYHHQALWNNRQHPRVHEAFTEIWGTEKLWVSFDRANMTPPERPDTTTFNEPLIHWDFDASLHPDRFFVQGVLYLTDTDEHQGGFQCVPGFHRQFHEWVKTQPADRNPHRPDMTELTLRQVPGKAGDLVIWHSLLPHGNSHNTSDRPRWSQYILMHPAREDDEALRQERLRLWRERLTPPGFPGDPRQQERLSGQPARLTALGKKLLGLERWETA